jgi:mannose-6-phosphate isomerase-like protein (cupin superfamily)
MKIIKKPAVIKALGKPPKKIEEFIGLLNTKTSEVSIARMISPRGWSEPPQTPEFDEYSVVLEGSLRVKTKNKVIDLKPGESVIIPAGTWVQYMTPKGAVYMSVCLPAFAPEKAHRDI